MARSKASDPSMVERMAAVQNAAIELGVAKGTVQEFASAPDSNMRFAAKAISASYDMMRESMAIQSALLEKMDNAKSEDDLSGIRGEMTRAKVAYQQGSTLLVEAMTIAVGSAVVAAPQDTNRAAHDMTATEFAGLLSSLESRLGSDLREPAGDADTGPMHAAKALLHALDQKWPLART